MRSSDWVRVLLIVVLILALAAPAQAYPSGAAVYTGIVVVCVGIAVIVTVLVLHHPGKQSVITGCITSGANGLSLTDEKDHRAYALSGDTIGVKPGDRAALKGRRNGKTAVFTVRSVARDFGPCTP